jgi:4-hydroxy-tetrahydrodipicolinate synthase
MLQSETGRGVIVPMITPFTENGKIDLSAVEKIVEYLISAGTAPFILGTTGESASIPDKYRPDFVKTMVKTASGRAKTYAGISSPSFETSVEAAIQYFELGVDAVVAHPPSYYPLSGEILLRYYVKLANSIPGPLILYNIPIVTHVSIPVAVLDQLSHHEKIIGIKDSERDIERFNQSLELWATREDFVHLVGWGAQMANGLRQGSAGLVPSTGNLVPKMYKEMLDAAKDGNDKNLEELQQLTDKISAIYQKDRTLNQSLPALKMMMKVLDLCEPYVLPPLEMCNEKEKEDIIKLMEEFKFHEENQTV